MHAKSPYDSLLSEFRNYLTLRRNHANLTVISYTRDAMQYLHFLEECKAWLFDKSIRISARDVEDFYVYLRKRAYKDVTIQRKLVGVYNFWLFLYRTKRVHTHPVPLRELEVKLKRKRRPTKPLSPQDYNQLRNIISHELSLIY